MLELYKDQVEGRVETKAAAAEQVQATPKSKGSIFDLDNDIQKAPEDEGADKGSEAKSSVTKGLDIAKLKTALAEVNQKEEEATGVAS